MNYAQKNQLFCLKEKLSLDITKRTSCCLTHRHNLINSLERMSRFLRRKWIGCKEKINWVQRKLELICTLKNNILNRYKIRLTNLATGKIVQNKKLFTIDNENLENSSCEYILLEKTDTKNRFSLALVDFLPQLSPHLVRIKRKLCFFKITQK